MTRTCRAANMQHLIKDEQVYHDTKELIDAYNEVHFEDRRGTRIRETFTEQRRGVMLEKGVTQGMLEDCHFQLLCQLLGESPRPSDPDLSVRVVTYLSRLSSLGVSYRCAKDSHKDSNILFSVAEPPRERAGKIEVLFCHTRLSDHGDVTESFLIVRPHLELNDKDSKHDPYRQYKWAGGRICYDRTEPTPAIIRPSQILSHFAKTPMTIEGIAEPCIHVLPLNRVRRKTSFSDLLANRCT
ncbi:hypothetical protein EIP86_000544 [Pleurotus ostreatoroseus]|nr:hypothetical protein EIP86_000544 [Pleurotus ostreatoroseus]